jgi:spore coat protein A, manganese oxidase
MNLRTRVLPFLFALILSIPSWSLAAEVLNPVSLAKFVDPLPIPLIMPSVAPNQYEVGMWEVERKLHRDLRATRVWAYGPTSELASIPGPTFEATRGTSIDVRWTNHLPSTHLLAYAIDTTLHMARPTQGIPTVVHLHGGLNDPASDGGPLGWFTQDFAEKGPSWKQEVYHYNGTLQATTLWYHDHTLGLGRLNVYAGLAGMYVLRDPANEPANLPAGTYEVPLIIQDRTLTTDGQLFYPHVGDNPEHAIWVPEFFGDEILVNGKVWPYLEVQPRQYRFRMLNASNARFYSLALVNRQTGERGPAFHVIGTDGGFLASPVVLNEPRKRNAPRLVLGVAERADVVIDFSGLPPGTEWVLENTAAAPFPDGDPVDPATTGQVMLFRVGSGGETDPAELPTTLNTIPDLGPPSVTRTLTLNELEGENGPLGALLNGMMFDAPVTEKPTLGTTEVWEIVNLTEDTHPIHIHLGQFQLLNRQKFNVNRYEKAFEHANPEMPSETYTPVSLAGYLKGGPRPPDPSETGWKDTFRANPGEVTRVKLRFAQQNGSPYPFDATAAPGYVWHCHILEHEDNDMMRTFMLQEPTAALAHLTAAAPEAIASAAGVEFGLAHSSPNPSTNGATLRFRLKTSAVATVDVLDVAGRRVRRMADHVFPAGESAVVWDGRDEAGLRASSGIYFVRLTSSEVSAVRRLVLVR